MDNVRDWEINGFRSSRSRYDAHANPQRGSVPFRKWSVVREPKLDATIRLLLRFPTAFLLRVGAALPAVDDIGVEVRGQLYL